MQADVNQPRYATLQDYLRLLRRQRFLIVGIAAIFAVAAFVISLGREATYTAQASLTFRDVNQDLSLFGEGGSPEQAPGERAAINAELITRPSLVRAVNQRLGAPVSDAALEGAISTRVDTLSNLLLISARWESPEFAARLANAFSVEAVDTLTQEQQRLFQRAINSLERRLELNQADPTAATVTRQQIAKLEAVRSITQPARIVRKAEPPAAPSGPNTYRNTLLGLIVGLAVGFFVGLMRDSLDRRLRGSREVHEELELPILGSVNEEALGQPGLARNGHAPISAEDFEAFRVLRTNLQFLQPERDLRSILITSCLPEEGKSTTAISLASAATIAGRSTLLVECDLRRPSLAGRIGINPEPGLLQYLTGEAHPQDVVQLARLTPPGPHSALAGEGQQHLLACITAGGSTPDSAELLSSQRCREFLAEVSAAYELVVIDTSPALSVVDPLELVPHVEGVIVCVRLAQTTRDEAHAMKAALNKLPTRPTGIVVTGIGSGDDDGYSYYGYGYGT